MPSPMPRQTRAVLVSLSSCAIAAFPVLKPGRRSHHMISGPARCSFALRPARSLTPFKGAFSIEGFGRLVASSPAPIATGWSEICRVGFLFNSPTGVLRLSHGALQQSPSPKISEKTAAKASAVRESHFQRLGGRFSLPNRTELSQEGRKEFKCGLWRLASCRGTDFATAMGIVRLL